MQLQIQKQIKKEAIAVYNPEDTWERAIQDASKHVNNEWLSQFQCSLLAQTVGSLTIGTNWLDNEDLLPIRAAHLFSPAFNDNKNTVVLTTYPLFFREIIENQMVASNLHSPIALLNEKCAFFLFRNRPLHIYVNNDLFRDANKKISLIDVASFLISESEDVVLTSDMIVDVQYYGKSDLGHLLNWQGFRKAAASEWKGYEDIYKIDEMFNSIYPDNRLWDKRKRANAVVEQIDRGENSIIHLKYTDTGEIRTVNQNEFNENFVII